jgi:hypothetical protein
VHQTSLCRRVQQAIQYEIGGFDDALITRTQIRLEGHPGQVLQPLNVPNRNFIRLVG